MKIQRHLDSHGNVCFAQIHNASTATRLEGDLLSGLTPTGEPADIAKVLAPLEPRVILCSGLNYRQHAEEVGAKAPRYPVLFIKTATCVQNPGDPIFIPTTLASHEVDYECELAVIIGRTAKNVGQAEALDYVLGYTCANDVSARDWQVKNSSGQWCRGKMFDSFAPLGPWIVTREEIPNPDALGIRTILNGTTMQDSNTSDMIFSVAELIAFFSASTTLLPGTVILTGTPSGVGMSRKPPVWLRPGDSVTIAIESIGDLTNPVALEPQPTATV
jgi:2-keto-4-pentenoate hydratase/2-oxohepta-3-ene-1,7-dioic acid hydratase in catechol pathway